LNREKCFFEVVADKFLGFMVFQKGIEANPDKCEVILSMRSLNSLREVQRLKEKLAALPRFIFKLTEKAKLLYKLLKGAQTFEWNNICEEMFQRLKQDTVTLPILASHPPQSTLYLYLAVSS